MKLNSSAQFQWVKQVGNADDEATTALAIGSTGIYSAVGFTGTISVLVGLAGGTPVYEDFISNGGQDILLTKHTLDGDIMTESFGHIGGDLEDQCTDLISLCKKTATTALFSFLKQSFTKSKLLDFKNFESLVFGAFLSKTGELLVFLLALISVCL